MMRDDFDEVAGAYQLAQAAGDRVALARLVAAYPQHEDRLLAFALFDAAVGTAVGAGELARHAHAAAALKGRALAAIADAEMAEAASVQVAAIAGILARARAIGLEPKALAAAVGLPRDVLLQLDRRLVSVGSVPRRLLGRLADALQTSAESVQGFLAGGPVGRVAAYNFAAAAPQDRRGAGLRRGAGGERPGHAGAARLLGRRAARRGAGGVGRMDRWSWVRAAALAERDRLAASGGRGDGEPVGLALVERLLAGRGYEVGRYQRGHPLLAGAWAALFPEMELAACDASLSRQRQAFALAHELGHLVIHEPAAEQGRGEQPLQQEGGGQRAACSCGAGEIDPEADPQDALLGALEIYNPRQQRELEANVFALGLLLPRPLLWQLFVAEALGARAIAKRLEVSHAATLQALAGLLSPAPISAEEPRPVPPAVAAAAGRPDTAPEVEAVVSLDPSQRAAATLMGSPALVQAGPGTGKTGTLVGRACYLVETGTDPARIAVLTFSNRAVGEVRTRLLDRLGPRAQALTVATFHAFAHELLRRYAPIAGLRPDFQVLGRPGLLLLLQAHLAEHAPPEVADWISLERPARALAELIETVARLKEDLLDAEAFARRVAALGGRGASDDPAGETAEDEGASERLARQVAFYRWYERLLATSGVLDYGDLIMRATLLLEQQTAIRSEVQATYPQLLVDEYQDINWAAAALIGTLSDGPDGVSLWAVGDPRQSIYRWRGAAPDALGGIGSWSERGTGGESDAAGPQSRELGVQYRAYGPIVRLCGGVAAAMEGRPAEEGRALWRSARGEAPIQAEGDELPCIVVATAAGETAELAGIARTIGASIANGRVAGNHAVLCATHAQADAVATALGGAGLPVTRRGEAADDPAVRQGLAVLALAAGDGTALLRITGAAGLDRADSMALIAEARTRDERIVATLAAPPDTLAVGARNVARELASALWSLPVMHRERGIVGKVRGQRETWASLAQYLFDAPFAAARPLLAAGPEPGAGYPAMASLLACARDYDRQPPAMRATSLPLQVRLLLEAGEGLPGPVGGEDTAGGAGVRVLTVHASKGLEFPVVFVPNLAKGRFPGQGRGGPRLPDGVLAGDQAAARAADERCLFFVAISRARDRLVLSRAERYGGRSLAASPLLALTEPTFALEPPVYEQWAEEASFVGQPADQQSAATDPDTPEQGSGLQPKQARGSEAQPTRPEVEATDLETYLRCPRRYYYARELGLLGAEDGQGFPHFHRAIRRTLARMQERAAEVSSTGTAGGEAGIRDGSGASEGGAAILAHEWGEDHQAHPYEALYLARAQRVIDAMAAGTTIAPDAASSHDADYRVSRPAGTVRLRIDRVDKRQGSEPVAMRYRSGRPSAEHRRDHGAALYQAALQEAHGGGSVRQAYIAAGTVDAGQPRPSTLAARLRDCDEALEGIAARRFPARPGDQCPSCPFWLICPEGTSG